MTRLATVLGSAFVLVACSTEPARDLHGTAKKRDALSSGVVISEVYGGGQSMGAAYRYDFVELFNRGTSAVDVTGWSVQYAGATSGAWQVTTLADAGMLQPGRYLLIRMGTQGAQGSPLPPHDFAGASLMSNSAGKVALVAGGTALTTSCPSSSSWVDLVGYGAAGCAEGSPTPTPAVDASVQRRLEGCRETDDNLADFVLGTPTPMSSAAAPVDCATVMEPDAGCRVLTSWPTTRTAGAYVAADGLTWAELHEDNPDGGDGNLLSVELYWPDAGLSLPYTESASSTYAACQACAWIGEGCDPQFGCAKFYFQQAGSVTVTAADRDELSGQMAGSLTGAKFVEWDFGLDQAVAGGGCVELGPQAFAVSWGGAGGGGGSATGGGAGGGAATGGGGGAAAGGGGGSMADAGAETDGGSATDGGSSMGGGGGSATGGGGGGSATGCGCSTASALDSTVGLLGLFFALARTARRGRHERRRSQT